MVTTSLDPSARRSFETSPWRPLRTAGGGSSPHSASTRSSVGTARPALSARTASRDRSFAPLTDRSEEHTSELQSLMRISYAVFCLKKNNILKHIKPRTHNKVTDA